VKIHLGIDDTDSLAGGCTTKIAADLVRKLGAKGVAFLDYPNLIRLNPNVPWKTRGNGAVCLRIESELPSVEVLEIAAEEIERSSRLGDPGTDPAIVLLGGAVPSDVVEFSEEALTRVVTPDAAVSLIKKVGSEALSYGSARGIVGALAAIGTPLANDYTFELIAYRSRDFIGKPRLVDRESVVQMNEEMREVTFNNVDAETGRILITPRGPDPILCGLRGESPEAVRKAFHMLRIREPVENWMIFRTNQGTDAHLMRSYRISGLQDHSAVVVEGVVKDKPRTIRGGHVIFLLEDGTGSVHCAAYEPTGRFRDIVRKLEPGDRVRGFGGMRAAGSEIPRTLNLEKLEVLKLVACMSTHNPVCPICGKRMKSAGKNQGYRCEHCRSHAASKIREEVGRDLDERIYLPPPRAHRHLTKPEARYLRARDRISPPPQSEWHFLWGK
jgi:tRNA(Ile2)-agmatinylcytidine synthase